MGDRSSEEMDFKLVDLFNFNLGLNLTSKKLPGDRDPSSVSPPASVTHSPPVS